MTGAPPTAGQTVLVRDGRITEVDSMRKVRIPSGATIVDGTGKYLIPGLFEMHGHTSGVRVSALGLYLASGVTTIRDQGSDHADLLRWRNGIKRGDRIGPRLLIAGPYLESRRNVERQRANLPASELATFDRMRIAIGSPAEARRVLDSLAALELDHFKIRTVQDSATYVALGEAARAHGKRLVGHVVVASPELFLQAGQDGAEHGFPSALDTLPRRERLAFWRALASRNVGVVPTLVAATDGFMRSSTFYQALLADTTDAMHPFRPYLAPGLVLAWREQAAEAGPARSEAIVRTWPIRLKFTREMRAAGVRLMVGTDAAVLNVFPGAAVHEELRLFVDSIGMSPMEALESATIRPAEWLGLADSVGTIAAGKVADLVLLDASPLEDIANLRHVASVVLGGRLLTRRDLDALLTSAKLMGDSDR